jgi:hypothetical protein
MRCPFTRLGRFMNTSSVVVALLVAWTVNAGFAQEQDTPTFPTNWFTLRAGGDDGSGQTAAMTSVTVEAAGMMHNWSVSFPEVDSLSGRAKFLPNTPTEPAARPLAYEVELELPLYARDKVPDPTIQYPDKIAKPDEVFGAYYDVYFTFTLRDADGFVLKDARSDQTERCHVVHTRLEAGNKYRFKGVTTNAVSPYTAAATKDIDVSLTAFRARADTDETKSDDAK